MTTETPPQVTQGDVAARAGVSWQTVHRYLTNPSLVGDTTKAKVAAAIEELGFTGERVYRTRTQPVPLVHKFSGRADQETGEELARRGAVLSADLGAKARGWDAEIIRLALDWAFRPPEGVSPMPDDYRGAVDRITD